MKLFFIMIPCFAVNFLLAQNNFKGKVVNHNNESLVNALVIYDGLNISLNANAEFEIKNISLNKIILVKCLGYNDNSLLIDNSNFMGSTIKLSQKDISLEEVVIVGNKENIFSINPYHASFILDFELTKKDEIVELLSSNDLIFISEKSNEAKRYKTNLKNLEGLSKLNGKPTIYLLGKGMAFGFTYNTDSLKTYHINSKKFNWATEHIETFDDTTYYIRDYKDFNQTTIFSKKAEALLFLREITNEDKKFVAKIHNERLQNWKKAYGGDPAGIMGDIRLQNGQSSSLEAQRKIINLKWEQEEIYNRPTYNTLKLINDTVFIFAHDIDSILVYDTNNKYIRGRYINYHHYKTWKGEIIVNESQTKAYGRFRDNKGEYIAEINIITGLINLPLYHLEKHFPTKIRINNNVIYFLAKQPDDIGKLLYKMYLKE